MENCFMKQDLNETTKLEEIFGYGIKDTLKEIEENLDRLSLTIVVEPYDMEASYQQSKQVFEYKLSVSEYLKGSMDRDDSDEYLTSLVQRIEMCHQEYELLLNNVAEKLKQLQQEYSQCEYKFSIIKSNGRSSPENWSDSSWDSEAELSFSSSNSSSSSEKRKHTTLDGCESEPEETRTKSQCSIEYPLEINPDYLLLGPNGTIIYRKDYEALRLKDAAGATRELCNVLFGESVLATHSLTGNQSPAFRGRERPIKAQLDAAKTGDITYFICARFRVTQPLVRATITTKCADTAKKLRRSQFKNRLSL